MDDLCECGECGQLGTYHHAITHERRAKQLREDKEIFSDLEIAQGQLADARMALKNWRITRNYTVVALFCGVAILILGAYLGGTDPFSTTIMVVGAVCSAVSVITGGVLWGSFREGDYVQVADRASRRVSKLVKASSSDGT